MEVELYLDGMQDPIIMEEGLKEVCHAYLILRPRPLALADCPALFPYCNVMMSLRLLFIC